jgi:hypothetical protein
MAKQCRPQRAGEERDAEGEKCIKRLRLRATSRKEHGSDNQGRGCAIYVEIIEFDCRADETCQGDATSNRTLQKRSPRDGGFLIIDAHFEICFIRGGR